MDNHQGKSMILWDGKRHTNSGHLFKHELDAYATWYLLDILLLITRKTRDFGR